MDGRELTKNFAIAFASQGISMGLSLMTSLLLPKVLGVVEFGYWQLFTFYMSYTVYAQLGVGEGIYLVNGGKRHSEMPVSDISAQFMLSLIIQFACAGAIIAYALAIGDDGSRSFVFLCVAAMLVLQCSTNFLSLLFQAVNEPNVYSIALIVNRITFLAALVPMLILGVREFQPYVIAFVFSNVFMLCFCLFKGRGFINARPCHPFRAMRLFFANAKIGLFLVFATGASTLSLGVIRYLLDITQPIETFSVVSLALSLVTFILSFISQVGMVLFPALRRAPTKEQVLFYENTKRALSVLLPGVYLMYYPLLLLLGAWLPEYMASLEMFVYLIPICVYEGVMQMVYATYFKVLRQERTLLAINLLGVVLSVVGSAMGVLALGNIEFALIALTVAYVMRSLLAERCLNESLGGRFEWVEFGTLAITLIFVFSNIFTTAFSAFLISAFVWFVFLFLNKPVIRQVRMLGGKLR